MKKSITSYITALINVHYSALERLPETSQASSLHAVYVDELNALLDFIEDIPENNSIVINLGNSEENKYLRKRVRELEESCESMCEVEKNLHKKIKNLEEANIRWQMDYANLRESKKDLAQLVEDLKKRIGGEIDG